MKAEEKIKDLIQKENNKGNIVYSTVDGLARIKLSDFIKQPIDGMLYDLNRSEEVVLTFINDPKWINDYAVCKVIRALKNKVEQPQSTPPLTDEELRDGQIIE